MIATRVVVKAGIREAAIHEYGMMVRKARPISAWWLRTIREEFLNGLRRVVKAEFTPRILVQSSMDWESLYDEATGKWSKATFAIADKSATKVFGAIPGKVEVNFDLFREGIGEWADANAAFLVTEVTKSTQAAIRKEIAKALREGVTVTELPGRLQSYVGLHSRQITALHNYEARLVKLGLAPDKIAKQVGYEATKKLRYRTRLIADTEVANARVQGQLMAFEAAGIKKVRPILGSRPCDICIGLAGDDYTPEDAGQLYPVHPDCDCVLVQSEVAKKHPPNYSADLKDKISTSVLPPVPRRTPRVPLPKGRTGFGAMTSKQLRVWLTDHGVRIPDIGGPSLTKAQLVSVADKLDRMPAKAFAAMEQNNTWMDIIRDGGITAHPKFAHLRKKTPRGWEGSGQTWDDIPGCGPALKGDGGVLVVNHLKAVHGSVDLILHETAHAVDAGGRFSTTERWLKVQRKLSGLDAYEIDFPEEAWAELFAKRYLSPKTQSGLSSLVTKYFDKEFAP